MAELVSTRDHAEIAVDYPTAIVNGLAPDRGLYTSGELPTISDAKMQMLSGQRHAVVAMYVKDALVSGDLPFGVIDKICKQAYGPQNFPEAIGGQTVPVERIGNTGLWVQNLSLGPTGAFKDQALQPVPLEIDYVLDTRDSELLIIAATSGDTGSAANDGVKGRPRIGIITLSPQDGPTEVQLAQMAVQTGGNVTNVSVEANFDRCQELIKELMDEPEFKNLGALNSINIGRIYSQVAYYFSGYFQTAEKLGDPIDVVVPTGNFGNILAGHIARRMGLPIRNLIIATNENDVLHELLEIGVYRRREKEDIIKTSSPSMDIGVASNYERLVYEMFGNDPVRTAEYMQQFKANGSVSFADVGLPVDSLTRLGFRSDSSNEQDRIDSIRWSYQRGGMIIDPHTADAVTVARRLEKNDGVRVLCMSTALPFKFEPTIEKALGFIPERPERFKDLEERAAQNPDAFIRIKPELENLRKIVRDVREQRAA